jgi:hypothetical protein
VFKGSNWWLFKSIYEFLSECIQFLPAESIGDREVTFKSSLLLIEGSNSRSSLSSMEISGPFIDCYLFKMLFLLEAEMWMDSPKR